MEINKEETEEQTLDFFEFTGVDLLLYSCMKFYNF